MKSKKKTKRKKKHLVKAQTILVLGLALGTLVDAMHIKCLLMSCEIFCQQCQDVSNNLLHQKKYRNIRGFRRSIVFSLVICQFSLGNIIFKIFYNLLHNSTTQVSHLLRDCHRPTVKLEPMALSE